MPRVVITMPAYRAERTLEQTVADIPGGVADRLILVDDASPDNTAQLARELGIDVYVHRESLGYGGNQKTCYMEALKPHGGATADFLGSPVVAGFPHYSVPAHSSHGRRGREPTAAASAHSQA
jgi:glycosyltransferase involved in cell wall biosynthesis